MGESTERVARGAAWLDEVAPGWERKIDLGTLDIWHPCNCICGQVKPAGELENGGQAWTAALHALEAAGLNIVEMGMVDRADTDAWVTLIKERFDTGALSDAAERGE